MRHISILVPKGNVALSCIEGPFILFNQANRFMEQMGRKHIFNVQLVGMDSDTQTYDRLFKVTPDITINLLEKTDLIIIPAVNGADMNKVVDDNKDFFPWIVQQHLFGAEVASLCVGAFLLAATGLVTDKKCATHWGMAHTFAQMYPDIELVSEKVITDEKGVYSSGGANSFWNLLLYIMEKYTNREMAILLAKYYEIEIDRNNQSQFTIFTGQKDHNDEAIIKAQQYIEENYTEKITVDQLVDKLAIGRRNLERRFKKATSNTVVEYIQRVKIEAVKKGLETSRKSINELMYDVGYSDVKAFRTVFKRTTGLSPIEYKNKYAGLALAIH
jgi:transcriptional regulator GlxA family with amidase domain